MPGNEALAQKVANELVGDIGDLEIRTFPDGESYVRILTPVEARNIVLISTLDHPDSKFLPLIFAAAALRQNGASEIGLVAPYLSYMRQDKAFHPGESVTSVHFAKALEIWFDWLVTIDPHLHRHHSLGEIYSISAVVAHAAPLLARWIKQNIEKPLIIGPDSESLQWVSVVAREADAPFIVLSKVRSGDHDVSVSVPDVGQYSGYSPVLVDDIISTGVTMLETIDHLKKARLSQAICLAVHGIFADDAFAALRRTGARIVTTNCVPHESNAVDVSQLLASAILDCRQKYANHRP